MEQDSWIADQHYWLESNSERNLIVIPHFFAAYLYTVLPSCDPSYQSKHVNMGRSRLFLVMIGNVLYHQFGSYATVDTELIQN